MNDRIQQLLDQITALEDDLRTALSEQPSTMFFQIKGKRVEFEQSIKETHRRLKRNFFRWLITDRPQNLITGPIIYAMIIPLIITDIFITFYQLTCFPIYGIKKVRRGDYIIFDRQQLNYLNFIEKFHCTYCAYGTGMIAYISEIVGRTEQYFCPIKHARKILSTHSRYARFLDYGDAEDYEAKLEKYRRALGNEK
ncbi:MAG: hypothetical protein Q8S46_09565 [Methylotenera sp.]|nr:hypothetical protein [Methylotenera sp.]MDO9232840.1 hypothetical protein [Methylotenera sp.]MDO9388976.1 hypothetical protein [Methylotenera sp.]MDP1597021.1 hypothetical protein [Methylotenera sp.]MDP1754442.1 hypothetical protein [Methylotenera sp.]